MKAILIAVVLLLSGCAQVKPVARIPFPNEEYENIPKASAIGKATVRGQAFLKTRGGDVKLAAGEQIFLNPVTSYSNQWYETYYLNSILIAAPDPRQNEYLRETIGDGSGRFTFKNVPAGEYYLTGAVFWEAATGYQGALNKQGGLISKRIKVSDSDDIEVILTR